MEKCASDAEIKELPDFKQSMEGLAPLACACHCNDVAKLFFDAAGQEKDVVCPLVSAAGTCMELSYLLTSVLLAMLCSWGRSVDIKKGATGRPWQLWATTA